MLSLAPGRRTARRWCAGRGRASVSASTRLLLSRSTISINDVMDDLYSLTHNQCRFHAVRATSSRCATPSRRERPAVGFSKNSIVFVNGGSVRLIPAVPPPGGMRLEKGFAGRSGGSSSNTSWEKWRSGWGGSAGCQGRRLFCASSSKAGGGMDADIDAEKCMKGEEEKQEERASSDERKKKSTRKHKKKKSSTTMKATVNSESGVFDAGSSSSGDSEGDGCDAVGGADDGHPGSDKGGKGKKKKAPWVHHRGKTPFGKPLPPKEKQLSEEDKLSTLDLNDGGWEDEEDRRKRMTYAGGGYGRAMAAHPEVLHALSTGLPNKALRDVIDSVRQYAQMITSDSRSSSSNAVDAMDRAMDSLKEKLAQLPHQADWALSLIRAHLEDERRPSSDSHADQLCHVRDANRALADPEEIAQGLLHIHAHNRFHPNVKKEQFEEFYPERWEEAKDVSSRLADRLPFQWYEQFVNTIRAAVEKDTPRKARLLTKFSKTMDKHAHLVVPTLSRFWRVRQENFVKRLEVAKKNYLQDQELLARVLSMARWRRLQRNMDQESELNTKGMIATGPWSIEEMKEKQWERLEAQLLRESEQRGQGHEGVADEVEAGVRTGMRDANERGEGPEDEEDDKEGQKEGDDENLSRGERRRRLRDSIFNTMSLVSMPDEIPKPRRPTAPLGMFDLLVMESPRELNMPPPRDIFGGDTPMGIGEAGMDEIPQWRGRDVDATRDMSVEDGYLWPEEKEAREKGKEEREEWGEGTGNLELSMARAADYQNVEDVLLTGKRSKRPPRVSFDDLMETIRVQNRKTRLLERSALVAELHPDQVRREELRLEEQGQRTVFVKDLPVGLKASDVEEAFSRCGEVEGVFLVEPTFQRKEPEKLRRRFVVESPKAEYVSSTPHALVSFKKKEGYEKAMARHFRVFGVNVNGVSVTTSPADDCRTVYVENTAMLTGEEFVNAINVAIQPNYKVMLESHILDDEMPQAVSIPLKSYAVARGIDELLRSKKFLTAFHYVVPKPIRVKHQIDDILAGKRPPGFSAFTSKEASSVEKAIFDRIVSLASGGRHGEGGSSSETSGSEGAGGFGNSFPRRR